MLAFAITDLVTASQRVADATGVTSHEALFWVIHEQFDGTGTWRCDGWQDEDEVKRRDLTRFLHFMTDALNWSIAGIIEEGKKKSEK